MTRPDPALVAECFAENRARLLATIDAIRPAIPIEAIRPAILQTPKEKPDHVRPAR